jgi:hypothetical protein
MRGFFQTSSMNFVGVFTAFYSGGLLVRIFYNHPRAEQPRGNKASIARAPPVLSDYARRLFNATQPLTILLSSRLLKLNMTTMKADADHLAPPSPHSPILASLISKLVRQYHTTFI